MRIGRGVGAIKFIKKSAKEEDRFEGSWRHGRGKEPRIYGVLAQKSLSRFWEIEKQFSGQLKDTIYKLETRGGRGQQRKDPTKHTLPSLGMLWSYL